MTRQTDLSAGNLLRDWRCRRRLSQLALSLSAGISARHLSFVETGRSRPSRELILRLAEQLDVPLRARNALLLAAGFAPQYPESAPQRAEVDAMRALVERILAGYEPWPAVAVDRHWNVVAANRAIEPLLSCVAPQLREPPVNVLRNTLHPEGMSSRILNLGEWRAHLLARLRRQADTSGDPVLDGLYSELVSYPSPPSSRTKAVPLPNVTIAVPLRFMSSMGPLNLISATMVFGTAADVTLSELTLETFFPVDDTSSDLLRELSAARERRAASASSH